MKLVALSCDSTESHEGWIKDILAYNNLNEVATVYYYCLLSDICSFSRRGFRGREEVSNGE